MAKTPNYVITREYAARTFNGDVVTIAKGSFVCPVEFGYLPREIRVSREAEGINQELAVYCYTKFGMVPILREALEQV